MVESSKHVSCWRCSWCWTSRCGQGLCCLCVKSMLTTQPCLQGGYAGKWLVEFEEKTQKELDEILAKRAEVRWQGLLRLRCLCPCRNLNDCQIFGC